MFRLDSQHISDATVNAIFTDANWSTNSIDAGTDYSTSIEIIDPVLGVIHIKGEATDVEARISIHCTQTLSLFTTWITGANYAIEVVGLGNVNKTNNRI